MGITAIGWTSEKKTIELVEGVEFANCSACHLTERATPAEHPSLSEKKNKDCSNCHEDEKNGLRGKVPLDHIHMAGGVACMDCHDAKPFKIVGTDRCRECHGSPEELSAATQTEDKFNPHNSPHYGAEVDCDLCHHLHKTSENVCAGCHDVNKPTP